MAGTSCTLTIPYGIPSTGANEYALQSGRELFRCGKECIKMFITNVMVEKTLVSFACGAINDAIVDAKVCLQSINGNWKDKMVITWIGKSNATSQNDNGFVINRVGDCGEDGKIYTHTEGTIGIKAQFDIDTWTPALAILVGAEAVAKLDLVCTGLGANFDAFEDPILSDISTNVSQTDWQGGGCNFQLFGIRTADATTENGFRANFNYQNGQCEVGRSCTAYDISDTPQLLSSIAIGLMQESSCSFSEFS